MPSDLIQKRLSQLNELSGELEKESDSINHLLDSFQRQLSALGLDVPAYVGVPAQGPKREIGYDRAPQWCLVHRSWDSEDQRWSAPQPLVLASRDVRVAALPILPKLLDAVKDGTEKTLESIRAAKSGFIEELNKI
jgi:hypothetical protein